jgi:hypothetical protein
MAPGGYMAKTGYLHFPDGTKMEIKPTLVEAPQNKPIQTTLDDLIAALQRLREMVGGGMVVNLTYSIEADNDFA